MPQSTSFILLLSRGIGGDGMKMSILVCMGGFSVDSCNHGSI